MGRRGALSICLSAVALVWLGTQNLALAQSDELVTHKLATPKGAQFAPDEVLVKIKNSPVPRASMFNQEHLLPLAGAQAAEYAAALPPKAQQALEQAQGKVVRVHPHLGLLKVKLPKGASVGQTIEALHRSGAVEYAEPNFLMEAQATIPNDPRFAQQWGLHNTARDADIDAPEAWGTYGTDGSQTVVAVIDTGVDYNHPDLQGNIWTNPKEFAGTPGVDDDYNNWVDDIYGINVSVTPSTVDPMDNNGHGTGLAGVIGAGGNNELGVCGVNWSAKIMALKALNQNGSGTVEGAITCINYALIKKADPDYPIERLVILLAAKQTPTTYSNGFYDALRIAQEAGALVVCAAGNDDSDNDILPFYPGSYDLPNIISVGASDNTDRRSGYVDLFNKGSNYGIAAVDLFAPGKDIVTTYYKGSAANYDNAYKVFTGTSMAAAFVAGATARVWSQYPDLNWKQVKGMLLNGVDAGLAKDFRAMSLTEGRLNLNKSLNPGLLGTPAVFSVTLSQAQAGDTITITGINFGPQATGSVTFLNKTFPAANIVSWTQGVDFDRIKVKIPAATVIPQGVARLIVTNTNGASRGASFANISKEVVIGHLILPRGFTAGAQVGSDYYVLGGECIYGLTGHVEKFSLLNYCTIIDSNWMMPTPVSNAGAAAIGNLIHVVGGLSCNGLEAKLQILDTTTMRWSEGPPLPKPIMQAAVASLNNKLYVFGGFDKTTALAPALNTTYVYDPAVGTWETKAVMMQNAAYAAATPDSLNKIWVMGGFTKNAFGNQQVTVQQYNPATDLWVSKPHLVRARAGAGGTNYLTRIFCLHGTVAAPPPNTTKYDVYDDGEYFKPALGYWMPCIPRYVGPYVNTWIGSYTPGVGQRGNKIFVLGGITGTAPPPYMYYVTNNVWAFTRPN
jgi:subtilisin family serine protease